MQIRVGSLMHRVQHRKWAAVVAWCAVGLGAVGCGASAVDSAGADAPSGKSSFFDLFSFAPDPIADCAGLGEWLQDHPGAFDAHVERTGFTVDLQYRPAACTACGEGSTLTFTDPQFTTRVGELQASELFVLRVANRSDVTGDALELTDALVADIVEVIGRDTIPCSFLHVEATPPNVPFRSAIIGFDRPQDSADRQLVVLDRTGRLGGHIVLELAPGRLQQFTTALVGPRMKSVRT
jgi:hypothetical protein